MVKTIYDPRQSALRLNPDPEPASSKFEEVWKELVVADAEHRKYSDRKQTIEHMKAAAEHMRSSPSKVLLKDDKKWKAPPAFADGTSAVINKRRKRP